MAIHWEQPQCLLTIKDINKLWDSPAMKILHSNKKNELLVPIKTWVNLTDMILSK